MRKRLITVLAFAVLVSAVATFALYRFVAATVSSAPKQTVTKVVVASQNIAIGALIKETDLSVADWPGNLPLGAATRPEELIGRGVIQPIYQGEPILESRLAARGAGAGLAATIPTGMRAVAVRVNDVVGVSGFVLPGMHVDILVAGTPPGGNASQGTLTKTILQNIEVLSAGASMQRDAEGKPVSVPVVNLLVTPDQAEVLSLASNEMRTQFVLRNPLDKEETKTSGVAASQLFSGQKLGIPVIPVSNNTPPVRKVVPKQKPAPLPAPTRQAAPAPPPDINVEVITGTKKSTTSFKQQPNEEAKQ